MSFKLKLIFVIWLFAVSNCVFSQDEVWIEGKWIHTFDPDEDIQDVLEFFKDGRFKTIEPSSGRSFEGTYVLEKEAVIVSLVHQGEVFFKLQLTFDEKKDKLYLYSEETGNTSYYTRFN